MSIGMASERWFHTDSDGRVVCTLCPRECRLKDGDRGFCFVRKNVDGKMVLDTYGKSTGFCIDPIEKKPLNHFLPGTPVLSFGTAGCNLGCKFCQNWDISKSREVAKLSDRAMPDDIAAAAAQSGCRSVAYTYNDPVIWSEYAIDTAEACRQRNIKSVAVTAGYIGAEARETFFAAMDAANIDLKAFSESFYHRVTGSHLQPVLDTIEYVCNETDCWVELTNLIIPDANDDTDELRRMCDWVFEHVGPNVPIHFTAFHPDFRMTDRPRTSPETLITAFELARSAGLNYVYVGNVHDVYRQSTRCHQCETLLIERDWHQIGRYSLSGNHCPSCDAQIPGHFEGEPGNWGQRRQRIQIRPTEIQPTQIQSIPSQPARQTPPSPDVVMIPSKPKLDLTSLTGEQRSIIHRVAGAMISAAVHGRAPADCIDDLGELAQRQINGVYLTLKRGESLRGCCGMQGGEMALGESMADSAFRTTRDPRMPAVSEVELPFLTLSVSLLGPPRPIDAVGDDRVEKIEIGKHGIRIRMGSHAGLLLPSVATEQNWNARQFLDALCRKAGLPAGSWRSDQAEVMLFDGVYFSGSLVEENESIAGASKADSPSFSQEELQRLTQWIAHNLVAIKSGATPQYYADGVRDLSVEGYMLSIACPADSTEAPKKWLQLSLREAGPLQASLFQTTQNAANALPLMDASGKPASTAVGLGVLTRTVHHGPVESADLRGVSRERRAVVVTDGRRWSVCFDRQSTLEQSLQKALDAERMRLSATQVYTMVCDGTDSPMTVSLGPRSEKAVTARAPAVAGQFYPASDETREAQVDELFDGLPDVSAKTVHAAMVPHAGLRFSGRVAADTWRRLKLPSDVLIIGPKHTPDGVDWAVAPHDRWQISDDASLEGNPELAKSLVDCSSGLQLDAGAHRREHGIEVQFPILYRLAPQTRVTAIAMQGGSVDEIRQLAGEMARWIRSLDHPPLLVISSDMNHFADETENRRRDRLALDAMKTGDAERLLSVCAEENISMCGQLPAAVVMMILRELDIRPEYEEIAYATSADYGGDRNRVVGYAGVLL